ncbi:TadE/TadG family type IV pilus assembly protein [Phenylobacterium sp.]|jgi:Flp pilus assembly protein TadG|uniref:TadE/TadG family type IV pilus assembly protein n=1 Tax=Phenylobacterium sp. TaxID=1871053 RepID=UPI003783131A
MSPPARLTACRRGSAAVETAFVLPVLLLMLTGAMELGRLGWTQASLEFAVEEGARCAAVRPALCGTPAATAAYAAGKAASPQVAAGVFVVTTPACGVQVAAEVRHQFVLRKFFPAPLLKARSCRA